jgi:hypothetical protein
MDVWVRAPGFLTRAARVPPGGDEYLRIVLNRREKSGAVLLGRVLDQYGGPLPGAYVTAGRSVVTSDVEGTFVLDLANPTYCSGFRRGELTILAVKEGHFPDQRVVRENALPELLTLQLATGGLTLAGRVVDERGRALPDVEVWLLDAVEFGAVPVGPQSFELRTLEQIASGASRGFALTDEKGDFHLGGLVNRRYVLELTERATLASMRTSPLPAGTTGLFLVLPYGVDLEGIGGRVVFRDGSAVPNIEVTAVRTTGKNSEQDRTYGFVDSAPVQTDGEGRFRITGVAYDDGVRLRLRSSDIIPNLGWRLPIGADPLALEVQVDRPCQLLVDWSDTGEAYRKMEVVDMEGSVLPIFSFEGSGFSMQTFVPILGPCSKHISVAETATELVFTDATGDSARWPLKLLPGEVNRIRVTLKGE